MRCVPSAAGSMKMGNRQQRRSAENESGYQATGMDGIKRLGAKTRRRTNGEWKV